MAQSNNSYLSSRLKRSLDITIATAAAPAYVLSLGACAVVDRNNPTVKHLRSNTDGHVFEVRKLNTKLFKKLGALMVASGVDEIPQVTNIVRGSMSVVGPRAILPEDFDAFLGSLPRTLLQTWRDVMPGVKPGVISTYALAEHASNGNKDRALMDIYDATHASFKHDVRLLSRLGRASSAPFVMAIDAYDSAEEPIIDDHFCEVDTQNTEPEFESGQEVA